MTNNNPNIKMKLFATKALKELRESKGYSQNDMIDLIVLENETSISPSTYQKIEQGSLSLTANLALDIAKLLRGDVRDLFERKEA